MLPDFCELIYVWASYLLDSGQGPNDAYCFNQHDISRTALIVKLKKEAGLGKGKVDINLQLSTTAVPFFICSTPLLLIFYMPMN